MISGAMCNRRMQHMRVEARIESRNAWRAARVELLAYELWFAVRERAFAEADRLKRELAKYKCEVRQFRVPLPRGHPDHGKDFVLVTHIGATSNFTFNGIPIRQYDYPCGPEHNFAWWRASRLYRTVPLSVPPFNPTIDEYVFEKSTWGADD